MKMKIPLKSGLHSVLQTTNMKYSSKQNIKTGMLQYFCVFSEYLMRILAVVD